MFELATDLQVKLDLEQALRGQEWTRQRPQR